MILNFTKIHLYWKNKIMNSFNIEKQTKTAKFCSNCISSIQKPCQSDIKKDEFFKIVDKFRTDHLWKKKENDFRFVKNWILNKAVYN